MRIEKKMKLIQNSSRYPFLVNFLNKSGYQLESEDVHCLESRRHATILERIPVSRCTPVFDEIIEDTMDDIQNTTFLLPEDNELKNAISKYMTRKNELTYEKTN